MSGEKHRVPMTGEFDSDVHMFEARRSRRLDSVYHAVRNYVGTDAPMSINTMCGRDAFSMEMGLVIWGDETNADLPRCQVCQRRTEDYLRPAADWRDGSFRRRADKERSR